MKLLKRFRQIALLVALPISFPLAIILGIVFILTVVTISESLIIFLSSGEIQLHFLDYLQLFLGVIFPVPATLWLYRLIYSVLGSLYVRYLGKEIDPIQGEQPESIETNLSGIQVHLQMKEKASLVPWDLIREVQWVNYTIWRQPIRLFSTLYLRTETDTIQLRGITDGFEQLCQDVSQRLPGDVKHTPFSFSFLRSKLVAAVSLIAFLSTILLDFFDIVGVSAQLEEGQENQMVFSSVLLIWLLLLLFTLPAVTMGRLVYYRFQLGRINKDITHSIPSWAILLATISSILFALLGLLLLLSQQSLQ